MTENFSYQPFSAIPQDGSTKFLCRRDAKPAHGRLVGPNKQCAVTAVDSGALLVNFLKIGVATDPLSRTKSQALFAADSEPLAPLCATPLQHQTAVLGRHADQEPVRAVAVAVIWLKRALPLHSRPPKIHRNL
jgi:hypothetical protein